MAITERDYNIIRNWFEPYKYATYSQLQKVFFQEQECSYNIARKRVAEMKKAGYLKQKSYRDITNNKIIHIYNDDNIKPPSHHRVLVLDVLAEMKYQKFNVEIFDIEKFWDGGKYRSDAFAVFTVEKRRYHMFVEVQISNNYHNLEKYDDLYKTGYVQKYLNKDFYPNRILLISNQTYPQINLKHLKVIQINTNLECFSTILL